MAKAARIVVFICTNEPFAKIARTVGKLVESAGPDTSVVATSSFHGDPGTLPEGVAVHHWPGLNIFEQRAKLPALIGDHDWMVVLEDHNSVDEHWLGQVHRAVARAAPETTIIIGATSNLVSLEPWSWANYLAVQAMHWSPVIKEPAQPLGFNAVMRADVYPRTEVEVGRSEYDILARAMEHAVADPSFPIDHEQHRHFPEVLQYHWANGRATGSGMRDHAAQRWRSALKNARYNAYRRPRQIAAVIVSHPLRKELPYGIRPMVLLLCWCHALGVVWGTAFGAGRSMEILE